MEITINLKQELIYRLCVPENWNKYDYQTQRYSFDDMQEVLEGIVKKLNIRHVSNWVAYDSSDISSRPKKHGKYFVHRKDGKVHWETWNGSGWAYNEKVITHWQEIKPPCF